MADNNTEMTEKKEEKNQNIRQIVIYLLITFVLTYGTEIFLIMPMVGSTDTNEAYAAQSLIASIMFIPAISALITRFITKERMIGSTLMLGLNLKGNLKYYGLVWFGFALLILLGAALYFVIYPEHYDGNMGYVNVLLEAQAQNTGQVITPEQMKQVMMQQIIMGIFLSPFLNIMNCLGEEWGWRGFLLPKMLKQFKVAPAILISGVIWGLWHAPLTVMGHNYGVGYRGYPVLGIFAMCIFCITLGTILSYVTIKTKSCIPAILGHGMMNGFASVGIYFTSLENPYNVFLGPAPTGIIGGIGFIFTAAFLLYQLNKEERMKEN